MNRIAAVFAAIAILGLTPVATAAPIPEGFVLGRDVSGEPCAAARAWADGRLDSQFDRAWAITCRGVAASRPQGSVLAVTHGTPPVPDPALCGAPVIQAMRDVGPVETRACFDRTLGLPVATILFDRRGVRYVGAAAVTALGPLEATLRTAAGIAPPPAGRDAVVTASIDPGRLPPAPSPPADMLSPGDFDATTALQTGIALNHRGVYVEASRLLNDALSRLPASAPALTRVELELEAGLADSNISQIDAAADHFTHAGELLAAQPNVGRAAFLQSKRATYTGLDLINRRRFTEALAALGDAEAASQPLRDPAILSELNQSVRRRDATASIAASDTAMLSRLLLEAQRQWARSVALLAVGDPGGAGQALDRAVANVAQLQRSVDPGAVVALKSRIQRQRGRVDARAGRIDAALVAFDCAVATLQGVGVVPGKPCLLDPLPGDRAASTTAAATGTAAGPMIAETELERASLSARRPGADPVKVLADFDAAVDALIASNAAGGIVPPSMETYLDLLAARDAANPSLELEERFFRAIQAVGEPAIARQVAQLQRVVAVDGALGAKVRDRAELERQIVRLRYQIGSAPADQAAALERERQVAEGQLIAVNAALSSNQRYRAVDDQPATIAEIRAALRPGEAYLKITRLRGHTYGVAIDRTRTYAYGLAAPSADIDAIAARVRASIRDDSGTLPFFDVAAAYALFKLIAGPAEPALLAAKAIVVDPSGPLENLPAGVLVTDLASVKAFAASRTDRPNDYSRVGFLGSRSELSGALSPRSFLIARKLPESTAPSPFIGFGQNAAAPILTPALAAQRVSFGSGCDISYGELAGILDANRPVSAAEIKLAATALGDPSAPEVTGTAFTDRAVMAANGKGDYRKYQVIHFATHGLPETQLGCRRIPPALVTTLAPPGGGYPSDGLLSFSEIAGLRLDANLVVLSACETASGVSGLGGRLSGQDESAATLDGLVRAFITANARAVLATYWKVPASIETDAFIRTFYASGRTETIGAALRDAQRGAIAQPAVSHPYYWGAYFLVGDASKTMLSPAARAATQRTAAR